MPISGAIADILIVPSLLSKSLSIVLSDRIDAAMIVPSLLIEPFSNV